MYLKHPQAGADRIDGLFIHDLPIDHDNQIFVRAMVQVARGMRKVTIAECVEDQAPFEMLKGCGIDAVQGNFLGRPSPDYRRAERARMDPGTGKHRFG